MDPIPPQTATVKSIPPITKIEDGLYLGDSVSSRRSEILEEHNIAAVVSISHARWVHWRQPWYTAIVSDRHIFIPANDSMTQDLLPHFKFICDFIDTHRNNMHVLVHCDKGVSRSATIIIAYLMRTHKLSLDDAYTFVREKRRIKPNENFMEQLTVWDAVGYEIYSKEGDPKPEYAAFLSKRTERLQAAGLTGNEPIGVSSL